MPPASQTTATPGMERADQYKRYGKGNPSNKYYYTILDLVQGSPGYFEHCVFWLISRNPVANLLDVPWVLPYLEELHEGDPLVVGCVRHRVLVWRLANWHERSLNAGRNFYIKIMES